MSEALRFTAVDVGHRGHPPALRGVSLVVEHGAFVLVQGRSGSGKSTLLRTALGLLPPLAGEVRRAQGRSAIVAQAIELDDLHPVSVAEVVASGTLTRADVGRRERRALVEEALGRVGLEGFASRRFSALSGGERQRAIVARAITSAPDLLVCDEPTSALDDASADLVRRALFGLAERGVAVLCATHEPGFLGDAASAVFEVEGGRALERARDAAR